MANVEKDFAKGKPVYVGLDVHKRQWVVTVQGSERGLLKAAGRSYVMMPRPRQRMKGSSIRPGVERRPSRLLPEDSHCVFDEY